MKRLLVLPLAAFALLVWGEVASADHDDFLKPLCADIVDANTGYTLDHVATSDITTNVPSCRGVTYSVVIQVDPGGQELTFSSRGNGASTSTGRGQVIIVTDPIVDDDNTICVYVTTSRGGPDGTNQQFDRFPDTGCTSITAPGSGGTGGHA
jgi:hypothetical protein